MEKAVSSADYGEDEEEDEKEVEEDETCYGLAFLPEEEHTATNKNLLSVSTSALLSAQMKKKKSGGFQSMGICLCFET